jgi:hypothetical protein
LEVSLNFLGGIGINQIIAQITKKINRFNAFPLKAYSVFAYLRITGSVFFEKYLNNDEQEFVRFSLR